MTSKERADKDEKLKQNWTARSYSLKSTCTARRTIFEKDARFLLQFIRTLKIVLYYIPSMNFLLFCSEINSVSRGVKYFTTYSVICFLAGTTFLF